MKKIILSICFLFTAVTFVAAQRAAERKAQIKQGLKEEVKLTDDQIASVMAIEDEYRPKLRAIKTDSTISDENRKAKTKTITEEKRSKVEAAVGKEAAQKVEAFYASLKKNSNEKTEKKEGTEVNGQKPKKTGGKKENAGGDN